MFRRTPPCVGRSPRPILPTSRASAADRGRSRAMEGWLGMGQRPRPARPERAAPSSRRRDEQPTTVLVERRVTPESPGAPESTNDRASSRHEVRRALSSRRALRRAVLLHEILGPPKALEQPAGEPSSRSDGAPPMLAVRRRDYVVGANGHATPPTRGRSLATGTGEAATPLVARGEAVPRAAPEVSSVGQLLSGALGASIRAIRRRLGHAPRGLWRPGKVRPDRDSTGEA